MLTKNETEDTTLLIKVKRLAIDIVRILCFRHGEYFPENYIVPFFEAIWKLLPMFPASRDFN